MDFKELVRYLSESFIRPTPKKPGLNWTELFDNFIREEFPRQTTRFVSPSQDKKFYAIFKELIEDVLHKTEVELENEKWPNPIFERKNIRNVTLIDIFVLFNQFYPRSLFKYNLVLAFKALKDEQRKKQLEDLGYSDTENSDIFEDMTSGGSTSVFGTNASISDSSENNTDFYAPNDTRNPKILGLKKRKRKAKFFSRFR